jgi:anti-anti-sigma factor
MPLTDATPAAGGLPAEHTTCYAARFETSRPKPSIAVIAAHGELDAANATEFADYALGRAEHTARLVLDLTGIEFFGTAGFSALHTLNVRCAGKKVDWVLVPSAAVSRLLHLCDPDAALPEADTVDAAVIALESGQRSLQLVTKPR